MGARLRAHEISDILSRYKALAGQGQTQKDAAKVIAEVYDRPIETILSVLKRFRPSIDAASAYMQAESLRLAMRVVRKANVSESIDILSRQNIGVLAPKHDGGGNGGGGFFLSVTADTCGAVTMVAGAGRGPSDSLRSSSGGEVSEGNGEENPLAFIDVTPEPEPEALVPVSLRPPGVTTPGVPHPNQGRFGRFQKPESEWPQKHKSAASANRQRLKEARSKVAKESYYGQIDQK